MSRRGRRGRERGRANTCACVRARAHAHIYTHIYTHDHTHLCMTSATSMLDVNQCGNTLGTVRQTALHVIAMPNAIPNSLTSVGLAA